MRALRPILLVAAAIAALTAGCKSPCRQLSDKLCECSLNTVEKESCLTRSQSLESGYEVTAEQQAQCEAMLEGCDCNLIDTPEGKRACGLAR